jgi:hypothetical protein
VTHLLPRRRRGSFELGLMQRALLELVVRRRGLRRRRLPGLACAALSVHGETLGPHRAPGARPGLRPRASRCCSAPRALAAVHRADRAVRPATNGASPTTPRWDVAFAGLFPLGVILAGRPGRIPPRRLADFLFGDVLAERPSDVKAPTCAPSDWGSGSGSATEPRSRPRFRPGLSPPRWTYRPRLVDALVLSPSRRRLVVAIDDRPANVLCAGAPGLTAGRGGPPGGRPRNAADARLAALLGALGRGRGARARLLGAACGRAATSSCCAPRPSSFLCWPSRRGRAG